MNASIDTDPTTGKTSFSIDFLGGQRNASWSKWVWGSILIVISIPIGFFTLPWWKFMRLPMGALTAFFALNILENVIMKNYEWSDGARAGWIVAYSMAAVLGVIMFWKLENWSVALTCAGLLYLAGVQISALVVNSYPEFPVWGSLLIAIGLAVAGFFLGCLASNFTMIIATSGAGAFCLAMGVGIMTGQYPEPQDTTQAGWIVWTYFAVQMCVWVLGLFTQYFCGYKRGHRLNSIIHGNHTKKLVTETHVSANVGVRI